MTDIGPPFFLGSDRSDTRLKTRKTRQAVMCFHTRCLPRVRAVFRRYRALRYQKSERAYRLPLKVFFDSIILRRRFARTAQRNCTAIVQTLLRSHARVAASRTHQVDVADG